MEVNENNDAPVLNVEETQSGDSLVENAGNETPVQEEQQTETKDENTEEVEAFDPAAFMASEDNVENNEGQSDAEADGEDDREAWPDLPADDGNTNDAEAESTEATGEPTTEENQEASNEQSETVELDQSQFELFTKELGLEANSIDEVKDAIADLVQENNKLREQGAPVEKNKKIEDLENFSKLDDESLVKRSLEADGLTGEKLDMAVDRLMDSGMIDIEALKIRNNIDKAIQSERQNIKQAAEAEVAKQQQDHQEAVESFGKFMQSTDELFGFKLTGNPDKLPEVRKNHTEYVTSGKFLSEITDTESNLAEASWLWRNRAVLKNAMINNGRQTGRKEILDQIGRPETSKPQRFVAPDTGDFDPKKFMQG